MNETPTLTDALFARPVDGERPSPSRVHRLDNNPPPRPMPPAKPPQAVASRVHRILDDEEDPPSTTRGIPDPIITPFAAVAERGELVHPRGEITLPRGKKNTASAQGLEPAVVEKKRRGPKPGFKRKPKAATPNGSGEALFAIDDAGGITIGGTRLDPALTKRLEVFLDATKALRK